MNDNIQFEQLDCDTLCSTVSEQLGEEPIGTAAAHEQYILLELPLPWSKPLIETRHFPKRVKERIETLQADGVQFRLMAFYADDAPALEGHRRLFCYSRPKGLIAEFDKQEFVVPESLIPDLITELTTGSSTRAEYAAYEVNSSSVRDLFVCTHGRHDVCCGKLGVPLYQTLSEAYAPRSNGKLRAWQVSHVGGHRFAPTLIDFPSGRYWANINEHHLDALMNPEQMMPQLEKQYRGWSGIGLLEQIAEREIWIQEGPQWASYLKDASIIEKKKNGGAIVRIEYRSPDATTTGVYTAHVEKIKEITLTGCGMIEPTVQAQYEVSGLHSVELDRVK